LAVRYVAGSKPARYSFLGLDTSTELSGTGVSGLDYKAVGYAMKVGSKYQGVPYKYKRYSILEWGGDNKASGYETAFVNMYNLCSTTISDELSCYFNIDFMLLGIHKR